MTGTHGEPIGQPTITQSEPVLLGEAVRVACAAIAAAGWAVIPSSTVDVIVSAVALAGSVVTSLLVRRRVTPVVPPTGPVAVKP